MAQTSEQVLISNRICIQWEEYVTI